MANLGEKGKSGKNGECAKHSSRVGPNILMRWQKRCILTNSDFTKMTNLEKTYLALANIKTRWQKRYLDNCGLYENYIFCETGQFGKDWDNDATKQAYCQLAVLTKMGNLGKGGIEQKSIHDLAKPQMRWQKGNIDKKANFHKCSECAKNSSRVWPNTQMRWQKGACW